MHNICTQHCHQVRLRLPAAPLTPLVTTDRGATLHTVHRTGNSSFSVEARALHPAPAPPPLPTTAPATSSTTSTAAAPRPTATVDAPAPTSPTALAPVDAGLLLALRSGELYTLDPAAPARAAVPIGDVTDPDPQRSGVLAAATSPDGSAVALLSPVSLTILDASFTPVAELPHACVVASHAVLRWRHDSEHVVVLLRGLDARVSGFVADRAASAATPLQLGDLLPDRAALVVDWEPRANAPLCVAGPGACVSFLETNGLRLPRNDLVIAAAEPPRVLRWSPDARLLAVAAEEADDEGEGDAWRIAFYAHSNYTWYCKKRLVLQHRVVDLLWDEDDAGAVTIVCERGVFALRLAFVPSTIARIRAHAVACVVNGNTVELTNLSRAVVPPPLCHGVLTFDEDVDEVCASPAGDGLAALLSDGSLETATLGDALGRPRVARDGASSEELNAARARWILRLPNDDAPPDEIMLFRKPVLLSRDVVAVIRPMEHAGDETVPARDIVCVYRLPDGTEYASLVSQTPTDGRVTATFYSEAAQSFVLATSAGSVSRLSVGRGAEVFQIATESDLLRNIVALHEVAVRPDRTLTIMHDESGALEVIELTSQKRLSVSRECTSFCVHDGFLCFTTRTHLLYCASLDAAKSHMHARGPGGDPVPSLLDALDASPSASPSVVVDSGGGAVPRLPDNAGATRPIDRDSLLVAGLPGDVGLVLQAPRGNLETIAPRPIVFDVVHRLARQRDYARAFAICRKQRVSMNHVVGADDDAFLADVPRFVAEVGDAAQLAVFLSHLEGPTERINRVCDAVVSALRARDDSVAYTNAMLTGLVRRAPPDMPGALAAVRDARDRSVDDGCAAVEFLNVLVKDGARVYGEALGTYDVGLAAFVAEAAQLDPAEYAQELHALRAMPDWQRRYTIDLRLARHASALHTLFAQGASRHDECRALIHKHKLYDEGLRLFARVEHVRVELLAGYAAHLEATGMHERAAGLFMQTGAARRAAECYRQAGLWELAVSAVSQAPDLGEPERRRVVTEIADELAENGRNRECAQVRARWLADFDGAVEVLTRAEDWDAAFETAAAAAAAVEQVPDGDADMDKVDWWALVRDAVLDGCNNVEAMLRENAAKLDERRARLEALRAAAAPVLARLAARDGESGESDGVSSTTASSSGSSVLSDVTFATHGMSATSTAARSSAQSVTSLYASAHTDAGVLGGARLDRQAAKRAARAARKRVRRGDPRERDYLAANLRRLVPRAEVRDRVVAARRAATHVGRADVADKLGVALRALAEAALQVPDDVLDAHVRDEMRALALL